MHAWHSYRIQYFTKIDSLHGLLDVFLANLGSWLANSLPGKTVVIISNYTLIKKLIT